MNYAFHFITLANFKAKDCVYLHVKESGIFDTLKGMFSGVSALVMGNMMEQITEQVQEISKKLQKQINDTMELAVRQLAMVMLMIVAVVFLLVSSTFYLIEYHGFTVTLSFLSMGLIMLVLAFLLHYQNLKRKLEVQNGN